MTATEPTAPALPLPDALEFVQSGIIRFHFPTAVDGEVRTIRVRRPFLGELKTIRLALVDLQDEVSQYATKVTVAGKALQAESDALNARLEAGEVSAEEHADLLADIRRRDMAQARDMDRMREDATLAWWADLVFGTLALDDVPDVMEYPGWILDPRLPNLVLNHWRTVPSGPG